MYFMPLDIMGMGPWYRIGLSRSNAVILAALVETITTFNVASHSIAFLLAKYVYGMYGREPDNVSVDVHENMQWVLYGVVVLIQLMADVLFLFGVLVKGKRLFAFTWIMALIIKTSYTAILYTFTKEEWDRTYEALEALTRMSAFLWGTVVFGFCALMGIQSFYFLSDISSSGQGGEEGEEEEEDGRDKIAPVGQGLYAIRNYYREHLVQLAVVLLFSEIAVHLHRFFHYPVTAFYWETSTYLHYTTDPPPDELGNDISCATIVINVIGLILIAFNKNKSSSKKGSLLGLQKAWVASYVILTLLHVILFVYIMIDWSQSNPYPHMFHGFIAICVLHLVYKVVILAVYFKSMGPSPGDGEAEEEEEEDTTPRRRRRERERESPPPEGTRRSNSRGSRRSNV